MIELGIKGRQEEIVTEELTASHIGSGTVRVFRHPDDDRPHGAHKQTKCKTLP